MRRRAVHLSGTTKGGRNVCLTQRMAQQRCVSSLPRAEAEDKRRTMTDEWGKTPRDLHQHLSKYCIGQSLAKKVLSVAVFNHYSRITPILRPPPPPPPPPPRNLYPNDLLHALDFSSHPSGNHVSTGAPGDSLSSTPTLDAHTLSHALPIIEPYGGKRRVRPPKVGNENDVLGTGSSSRTSEGLKEPDPTLIHDPPGGREDGGIGGWEGVGRNFYSRAPPPSPPSLLSRVRGALSNASSTTNPPKFPETSDDLLIPPETADQTSRMRPTIEDDLDDVVIEKSNVLLLGPTGSGKSLLAKTLARILDVPFASSDATAFTQAGYVGEDVESCVLRLLKATDYDVARTEVGIIHIDECDKLARRGGAGGGDGGSWGGRDVAGEGVQQALLKLLEGTTLTLQAKPPPQTSLSSPSSTTGPSSYSSHSDHPDQTQRGFGGNPADFGPKKGVREGLPSHGGGSGGGGGGVSGGKGETFTVDTSNILFILSGSFVGLEKLIQRRIGKGSMGFEVALPLPDRSSHQEDEVSHEGELADERRLSRLEGLTTGDLIEYGFIPEFVGRLPVLAPLHPLSLSDLVRVLTEPQNSLTKQYRKIFAQHGCELQFSRSALSAIAAAAADRGGSARHLRGTLEDVLLDSMYEIPGSSVRFVAITAAVVRKECTALYFSRGQRESFGQVLAEDDSPVASRYYEAQDEEEVKLRATG